MHLPFANDAIRKVHAYDPPLLTTSAVCPREAAQERELELHELYSREHSSTTGSLLRCSSSGRPPGKPSRSSARALPSPSSSCRRPLSCQPSWRASSEA